MVWGRAYCDSQAVPGRALIRCRIVIDAVRQEGSLSKGQTLKEPGRNAK